MSLNPAKRFLLKACLAAVLGLGVTGLRSAAADLSPELQAKQATFKTAWDLIQEKKYQPALDILSDNLKKYPEAPTIDYEYVWSMYCMAKLGQYALLPGYYEKVSEHYLGEVTDPTSGLKRNWGPKLLEIAMALKASPQREAQTTLEQLAQIDRNRLRTKGGETGERGTHAFDYLAKGSVQVPETGIFPLVGVGGIGTSYEITATKEQLLQSPAWDPATGKAPPLSPREAIAKATTFVRSHGFPEAQVAQIELKRQAALDERWYYIVAFEQKDEAPLIRSAYQYAVILLDGTLLPETRPNLFPK